VQAVLSEFLKIFRPSLGCLCNGLQSLATGILKIGGRDKAPISIPRECGQIFLLGFGVKPNWLISHEAACALFA